MTQPIMDYTMTCQRTSDRGFNLTSDRSYVQAELDVHLIQIYTNLAPGDFAEVGKRYRVVISRL